MGVEGPLRRCCEATLRILRSSDDVLVTVVEVLRHDPLHQWTLSPKQIARLQVTGDDDYQAISKWFLIRKLYNLHWSRLTFFFYQDIPKFSLHLWI